ncbi:CDGSH iron-sulfur domain-containing protein [Methanolobus profundi]|uniref:Zn-finger domain of CDGSH type-containing protein n=1 Tax=Methanolobus profundi TaxID=487685 RepID=A0A1I4U2N1_9EURY|nr:CDGSH iron-sulfur domain-containing protein [Methanolobus profundi]SFM83278.1 Zn-finger domain of CDGSH type-containing protein [Methanolobus profundi]
MTDKECSIEVSKDGPYIVNGLNVLVNSKGEKLEVQPSIALCRCGSSKNKPFCDGSHIEIGFKDEKN